MDSLGRADGTSPKERQRQRELDRRCAGRAARKAIIYSNSIAVQSTAPYTEPLMACPICGKSRLKGEDALWQHLRYRHNPSALHSIAPPEVVAQKSIGVMEDWELALIRISNAETLDEAVEIALAALCGSH